MATLGPAVAVAGSGLLLSMILAGLVALATILSGDQLAVKFPIEGATLTWARNTWLSHARLRRGLMLPRLSMIALSVSALAFAMYSEQLVHGLPIHAVAGAIVVAVIVLNYVGVKPTTWVLIGRTFAKVALLMAFVMLTARCHRPLSTWAHLGQWTYQPVRKRRHLLLHVLWVYACSRDASPWALITVAVI